MYKPLTSTYNFHSRLENSRIKLQISYQKEKYKIGESQGFIINQKNVGKINNLFLVIPKHSIFDDGISSVKVTSSYFKRYTGSYLPKSFYTVNNLDIAILQIRSKYINDDEIINTDEFNTNLENNQMLFSFQIGASNSFFKSSNFKYFDYQQTNDFGETIKTPSVKLIRCNLQEKKINDTVIKNSHGMSGTLSFTSKSNKIHSMFIGTDNFDLIFIPIFYVKFMINEFENLKKNVGINFIDLKVKIDKNNKLLCIENYQRLKQGDIIQKINNLNIIGPYVFSKDLNITIMIDQYIMLYPKDKFVFTILSKSKNETTHVLVQASKVK